MKKIVSVNCKPRSTWNTATLGWEAAKGAESMDEQMVRNPWK